MDNMDEMDDILRQLENGENPALNALQEENAHDAKTAARFRAISKAALALGVAAVAGGFMTIGNSVFPLIGAVSGAALLTIAAGAWAASSLYTTNDNQDI